MYTLTSAMLSCILARDCRDRYLPSLLGLQVNVAVEREVDPLEVAPHFWLAVMTRLPKEEARGVFPIRASICKVRVAQPTRLSRTTFPMS